MLTFSLLGGLAQKAVAFDPSKVATSILPTAMTPGTCTADQAFIWKIAGDGSGYWARRAADETCLAVSPQAGPTVRVAIEEDTRVMSYRTLKNMSDQLLSKQTNAAIWEQIALVPQLPSCPASSSDGAADCYDKSPIPSMTTMLLPPGGFDYYGFIFHVSELANGRFDKQFVPNAEQRFIIDFEVLRWSMYHLGYIDDTSTSILNAMQSNPDLRIKINGWSMNPPVEPTEDEWNLKGGYQKWRARGGYPIHYGVATGRTALVEKGKWGGTPGIGIPICASIKCACPRDNTLFDSWRTAGIIPPDQEVHALARCIGAWIDKNGLQTGSTDAGGTWLPYIAVASPSGTKAWPSELGRDAPVADPAYRAAIVYKDPNSLEAFANKITKAMDALINMFCRNPAPIKDELKKTTDEKCVDKNQKTCAKGTPDCSCTSPPNAVKTGYVAFDLWAQHACKNWQAERAEIVYEPPVPEVPPELKAKAKKWPYFVAAGVAALGIVAIVTTTRQRRLSA